MVPAQVRSERERASERGRARVSRARREGDALTDGCCALMFRFERRRRNRCAETIRTDDAFERRAVFITGQALNKCRRKPERLRSRKCSTPRKPCTAWVKSVLK